MTCSDGGKPDCAEALARLEFFIDHELDNASFEQIKQHLDDCGPCLEIHDLERAVKALVARSCTEHAPETLRQRIMVRIREVHVTLSEQQPG